MKSLPEFFTYGQIKMRDGSLSEPMWLIWHNDAYHPLSRAFTGPGMPECSVEVEEHIELTDYE